MANLAGKQRFTGELPHLDDIRGAIQDMLANVGGMVTAASGNPYFSVQRQKLTIGDKTGDLSVTWNNILDAGKVAESEAATLEMLRRRCAELEARVKARTE